LIGPHTLCQVIIASLSTLAAKVQAYLACRRRTTAWLPVAVLLAIAAFGTALPVEAASRTLLKDNHSPEAVAQLASAQPIAPSRMLRMSVTMRLRNRAELDQLLRDLQDPNSAQYHRWLGPGEFQARFGATQADLAKVANWLKSSGLQIDSASAERGTIAFHGRADIAQRAFAVKIAAGANGTSFANLSDPSVPSDIAPLVASVSGLSNISHWMPASRVAPSDIAPQPAARIGKVRAFGPADLYSFYDQQQLSLQGIDGSGTDCMAIVEDSDFDVESVDAFDHEFDLPSPDLTTIYADQTSPGANSDLIEALLDVEYAHAAAPGAPIRVYVGDDNSPFVSANGALYDAAARAVSDDSCGSISISYALCGLSSSDFTNIIDPLVQRAAVQGQTVTVAAGDWGAAALTVNKSMTGCVVGRNRGVNELAADPDVLAVGGTMFNPKYDREGSDVGSRKEKAWKDGKKSSRGATGGGVSAVFSRPSYQQSVEPNQSMRTIPDVALGASPIHPGYFLGYNGAIFCCIGGTSLGAPYWSGISHLVQQKAGSRPGPMNSALYTLAATGAASGIRDARGGNNSFNGVKGYKATRGYDLATGLGTPDIGVLVPALAGP
jgi:subtilase family serine protease